MVVRRAREALQLLRLYRRIGRSGLFDPAHYLRQKPLRAWRSAPLAHYVAFGWRTGASPHPLFDAGWYLAKHPDVAAAGVEPLGHYLLHGGFQGRDPNPHFSSAWYLSAHPDVQRSGVNPLVHYAVHGAREDRPPSPRFDPVFYACQLEPRDPGRRSPLAHFLQEGQAKGLEPMAAGPDRNQAERVDAAAISVLQRFDHLRGEVALLVAHAPHGRLKPHVPGYIAALAAEGLQVVLAVACDTDFRDGAIAALTHGLVVRANLGFDFAAWAHLLRLAPGLWDAQRLYLLNDSVVGPLGPERLGAVMARVRASAADLVGLTESRERGWHLQSYFLALSPRALANLHLQSFFAAIRSLDGVEAVIDLYEARLAGWAAQAGLRVEALFPSDTAENPTLFGWRGLLDRGFPFIKASVLTGRFPAVDAGGWREAVAATGYDLALAEAVAKGGVADARWAGRPPTPPCAPVRRVAFYGPWNYESGLGEASRGYLSALMRLGLPTNLHGVQGAFHTHRRLLPGYDLRDFAEAAQVAIVHLNPDGWHLLSADQRTELGRAERRVGLWVWEMEEAPDFFRPNLQAVDAVWSPSRYCADILGRAAGRPSHVVPHLVPLPTLGHGRRPGRTILYAFDGSSYLSRKNPEGLVRAFAASGLAGRGWRLVLKTKALEEAGADARALRILCEATAAVELIDARLPRQAMAELFAGADVYASPHCAEGFGLTVAEAMAAAKLVVATDYSGPRDFLDAGCGFPVACDVVELEAGVGHYGRGGRWARVREEDLAHALLQAADRVEAGDDSLGLAARARIARHCSAEAVAAAIAEGLAALAPAMDAPR